MGRKLNPLGTGYVTDEKQIYRASPVKDDCTKGRIFKIVNENEINPVSLTPVGYKLVPIRSQASLPFPLSLDILWWTRN